MQGVGSGIVTPRLRRGRARVCVCVSVCLCLKILKTLAKEPFRQKDGLKADIYATCTITFMFMYVVVLETAVSAIYSATFLLFAPRVIRRILSCSSVCDCYLRVLRRILPCEIAAWRLSLCPIPGPDPDSNIAHAYDCVAA